MEKKTDNALSNVLVFICWLLILLIVALAAYSADTVTVKRVIDGDTFKDYSNNTYRIKCIDAPEIRQTYGHESKEYLSNLLTNNKVMISNKSTDKYGRIACNVTIDNKPIDSIMIINGMAHYYYQYCNSNQLLQLYHMAIIQKKGLFNSPNWVLPGNFRHHNHK